jgi:hypothetical protein
MEEPDQLGSNDRHFIGAMPGLGNDQTSCGECSNCMDFTAGESTLSPSWPDEDPAIQICSSGT